MQIIPSIFITGILAPFFGNSVGLLLARDAFLERIVRRTNRRAIAMMFVCLPVRLSIWTGVHCDHTMHFCADLSLWLDSPMFWAPRH